MQVNYKTANLLSDYCRFCQLYLNDKKKRIKKNKVIYMIQ